MKHSKKVLVKALFCLCTVLFMFGKLHISGQCAGGTIDVTLTASGSDAPVAGADLALYRVADYHNVGGVVSYTYTPAYTSCTVAESSLGDASVVPSLLAFIQENSITADLNDTTDATGSCHFAAVPYGMYIVRQTNSVGDYVQINPFFLSLPMQVGGYWYNVIAANPKVTHRNLMNVKVQKNWNDDGSSRPTHIQVTLKKGDTEVSTVTLSASNVWSYTWYDLDYSDEWSVEEKVPAGYRATYRREGNVIYIDNTPALIQTGQVKWPIPFLVGGGLFFLMLGWKLRRNDNEEETI